MPVRVTAKELYKHILENAEELDGDRICRVSLIAYLRKRGVAKPGQVRKKLVKALEHQGLVKRKHPRSVYLYLLTEDQPPQRPSAAKTLGKPPSSPKWCRCTHRLNDHAAGGGACKWHGALCSCEGFKTVQHKKSKKPPPPRKKGSKSVKAISGGLPTLGKRR